MPFCTRHIHTHTLSGVFTRIQVGAWGAAACTSLRLKLFASTAGGDIIISRGERGCVKSHPASYAAARGQRVIARVFPEQ